MKKILTGTVLLIVMFTLAACSGNDTNEKVTNDSSQSNSHNNMEMHSDSGSVPNDLKKEKDPVYKVGSQAIVEADHMKGMKGAKATIAGAYDTTVYSVSYTPTTGGEKVHDHKWVIQQEIKNAGSETLKPGTKVTLEADHMEGMKGAEAVIDSSKQTTVYMIDYKPTTGGEMVKNHKWVIESELAKP